MIRKKGQANFKGKRSKEYDRPHRLSRKVQDIERAEQLFAGQKAKNNQETNTSRADQEVKDIDNINASCVSQEVKDINKESIVRASCTKLKVNDANIAKWQDFIT